MSYSLHRSGPRRVGSRLTLLTLGALLALLPHAAAGQDPPSKTENSKADSSQAKGSQTAPRRAPPGHRDVRSIRLLIPDGGRVAYSPRGDRIAYDKANEDGLYDLYVADADGEGETCVTCNVYELRKAHSFNPSWAPGGDWLVFQVQDVARRLKMGPVELTSPLRAAHSELWVVPPEGRRAWQITQQNQRGGSPVDPHFAYDGSRLLWSERVAAQPEPWGDWVVRVAELTFKRGTPRLGKVKTYEPARGLVLASGFTSDDQGFLYGSGSGSGSFDRGLSLQRLRFEGKATEPVLADGGVSGEAIHPIPGQNAFAVASELGLPRPDSWHRLPRRREIWLVAEGRRERLTYFNHPESDHALGEALIDDLSWSPEGDRFLIHVVSTRGAEGEGASGPPGSRGADRPTIVREGVWQVVMDESYHR